MGRKHTKLPAQKPGKITICLYIVHYICHCTHPCIIHTICLYIVHYICHCTCPCIVCTTHPYIMCYVCCFAPVCASPIPSVNPSNDKCQEFPDGFPGIKYGEKNPSKIMVKFPHNVTLALHQVKFLQETPDTKRVIYLGNFMST